MTVAMVLTVLILLSSCAMDDVEYTGQVLENVQSDSIGATTNITLPTIIPDIVTDINNPPILTTQLPQTTPYVPVTTPGNSGCTVIQPVTQMPEDGIIETAEQLHAVLVNGDSGKNYTVVAKELDMSKYRWNGMIDYRGTFDFGGCVIKNAQYSLFISVKGGTIKNLVIAESNYHYKDDDAQIDINPKTNQMGNLHYSPVVRYAKDITISNVTVQSSVTVCSEIWIDSSSAGGIVGFAEGNSIVIENCHFAGEIITDSLTTVPGGIAGKINSNSEASVSLDDPATSLVRIMGCSNTGVVRNLGIGYESKVGGIVGWINNGSIIDCGNYGDVISNDMGQTAGIVGYVSGVAYVKNCINTASVSGAMYVGGICGYSNGGVRYFENCINLGSITTDPNRGYVGGIIGLIKNNINLINCFNLKVNCEKFAGHAVTGVVDPANSLTYGEANIINCANLSYVEDILNAVKAVSPEVFKMAQNGLLELA